MKKPFFLFLAALLTGCSSMIPYKNQNLDYLHGMEQNPEAYRGKIVSFGGEVKGVTEDARRMRLVIKIDVPFYYYATGKDPLSYELLLVSFDKKGIPQMTGIKKGSEVKVLARAANYETRKNLTGKPIAVLHLIAFALADRTRNKDFFRPEPPYKQLYESWKAGRLFFKEQPQELEERYPAPTRKTLRFIPLPPPAPEKSVESSKGIVYDEEEPAFILPPDPKPVRPASDENVPGASSALQNGSSPEGKAPPAQEPKPAEETAAKEEAAPAAPQTAPVLGKTDTASDTPKPPALSETAAPEEAPAAVQLPQTAGPTPEETPTTADTENAPKTIL